MKTLLFSLSAAFALGVARGAVEWAEGADVVVAAGEAVEIDATTPALKSLSVAGTVTVRSWNACIRATTVTVADGGVLTCTGAFEKEKMGRVWISCADLVVATGGKIDVSECGYLAAERPASGTPVNGYGPGASVSYGMGASHGGLGGLNVWSVQDNPILGRKADFSDMLYGDPDAPVEPGSSGRSSVYKKGGCGGGAVCIEATGRVTVNGAILASGGGVAKSDIYARSSHGTAGSGGSVFIVCETFAGAGGVIRADGGDGHFTLARRQDDAGQWINSVYGYETPDIYGDMAGGGGRIAIRYATASQTADLVHDMTISAASGVYPNLYCCKGPTRANEDVYHIQADLGTVRFSDGTLLKSCLGKGLTGQVVGFAEWTCDSLSFTAGFVRFMGEGFALKVTGDLLLSGENVRLDLGGVAMTNRVFRPEVWAGAQTVRLEVGGNLTVSDGARLGIRAAETNAANAVGATISVGETLTVGDKGVLSAACDPVSGGAPVFAVADMTVAAGGLLTAEGRGFAGATGRDNGASDSYWDRRTVGYGPTPGFGQWGNSWAGWTFADGTAIYAPATGGSHGGLGGLSTIAADGNLVYATAGDSEWRPELPGSGGGASAMSFRNGSGGGVIRVVAQGHIQVDGEVNADAGRTWAVFTDSVSCDSASGGAGGTIALSSRTFAGAATGLLTARGGDIGATMRPTSAGAGGGGRIAVWTGEAYAGRLSSGRVGKYESADDCPDCEFKGQATAAGGVNALEALPSATGATLDGGDGTVRFVHVSRPLGLLFSVR